MEEVTVTAHKRKKHAGKREEDLKDLPHAEPIISTLTEEELLEQREMCIRDRMYMLCIHH